jgi:hypothetical protein
VVPDSASIAVSFRFDDLGSDGIFSATATFLTSFSFMTAGFGFCFTSISFQLREFCPIDSSDSLVSTPGRNTRTHTLPDPPELGCSFATSTDCTGFGADIVITRLAFAPGPAFDLGPKGELLVLLGASSGFALSNAHASAVTTRAFGSLPLNLMFFGFTIRTQAYRFGTRPSSLTNFSNLLTYQVDSQD